MSWSTAEQSCKNLFGRNSSTLAIESVEEWEFLKTLLEPHEIGNLKLFIFSVILSVTLAQV